MHFLDWFETCPAWQAMSVSLIGIAVIMAGEGLLARLLRPYPRALTRAPGPRRGAGLRQPGRARRGPAHYMMRLITSSMGRSLTSMMRIFVDLG